MVRKVQLVALKIGLVQCRCLHDRLVKQADVTPRRRAGEPARREVDHTSLALDIPVASLTNPRFLLQQRRSCTPYGDGALYK